MKIELRGATPPIWRRVQLAGGASLGDVHYVIQAVFGWEDCHLHRFSAGGSRGTIYRPSDSDAGRWDDDEATDEDTVTLAGVRSGQAAS